MYDPGSGSGVFFSQRVAGCVVARDGVLVATGYNGSVDGEPHCNEVGHEIIRIADWENGVEVGAEFHCIRTIHAEINAIINACKTGASLQNCDWYINGVSCQPCANVIARLQPRRIFMCTDMYEEIRNKGVIEFWRMRCNPRLRTQKELRHEGIMDKET